MDAVAQAMRDVPLGPTAKEVEEAWKTGGKMRSSTSACGGLQARHRPRLRCDPPHCAKIRSRRTGAM